MPQSQGRKLPHYIGLALIVVTPVAGLIFWFVSLHLSPENQALFEQHKSVAEGYEAMGSKYRLDAIAEYEAAQRIAPWKGSVKQRLSELRAQKNDEKLEQPK